MRLERLFYHCAAVFVSQFEDTILRKRDWRTFEKELQVYFRLEIKSYLRTKQPRTSVFSFLKKSGGRGKVKNNLISLSVSFFGPEVCLLVLRLAGKCTAAPESWKFRLNICSVFQNRYRLYRLRTINHYSNLSLEIFKISYIYDYLLLHLHTSNTFFWFTRVTSSGKQKVKLDNQWSSSGMPQY